MTVSVFYGDAWELALTLKPVSIDCIVTSPPYFCLRDYGTATWTGGDPDCAHKNGMLAYMKSTLNGGRFYGEHLKVHTNGMPYRSVCGKCGAVRVDRQFGLERIPDCGLRGIVRVRSDLTEDQRAFVVQRLQALGLLDE